MPKRRRADDADTAAEDDTPRKTRSRSVKKDGAKVIPDQDTPSATPSGRKSILRPSSSKVNGLRDDGPTPKNLKRVLFTPTPANAAEEADTASRNDRSARRKSQRALHPQENAEGLSEDEEDEGEESLAKAILAEEDEEEDDEDEDEEIEVPDTPSKSTRPNPKTRPKGRRRERTPSPPPDLPPHELYFFQNRHGANKTSTNTLPSHLLLGHDDYFAQIRAYKDPHTTDIARLTQLHKRSFDQWIFELSQGFNLCLYGYGSKHPLVTDFAHHLYTHSPSLKPHIAIINGYTPSLTLRDILHTLLPFLPSPTRPTAPLPANPTLALNTFLSALSSSPSTTHIHLLLHTLDSPSLRKATTQTHLSHLSAHPQISLLATVSHPSYALLFPPQTLQSYRFLHHDTTTFAPYSAAELQVVEEVNSLLGRARRKLTGKDGVGYVLKSLPENARALFRILVEGQLAAGNEFSEEMLIGGVGEEDEDGSVLGVEDEEEAAAREQGTPSKKGRGKSKGSGKKRNGAVAGGSEVGVEYRTLYHKAVGEFVCTSEVNFRTLLKEFHDHQMIESRKDAMGTERLIVPFKRDELETILAEMV